ncbi:phage tail spike protein [Erysipelothrix anatis]|uniref:phage tail spike protein n=1 Tax=Erysipelothrix anatis TaxID=2683713 RepID=UPI00135712E5|nr:phage tail spike protein [Erysipelothrix anatis]
MWLLDKDDNLKEKLIVESAIHSQVVNGLNTLEFECQNAIEKYDRIVYKNERGHWEEFIAQRVTDGRYSSNVYAEHSSYELYASYVGNRRPTEVPSKHLEILLSETRWKVGHVEIGNPYYLSYYYMPIYTAIQNLCVKIEGEVQFRITVENGKIKDRFVDILNKVGSDVGKRFTYTKDLESVTRTILDDEVYTALIGRGRGEEIEDTGGFGRRIMFTDLNKVDSPKGTEYVFDLDALNKWGIEDGNIRRHRFGIVEFDDIEDTEELYIATKKKLQIVKEPRVSYECSVVLLDEPHENVSIGDVVAIIDKDFFGNEIRIKGRVIQLNKDLLNSNNSTVTLGNFVKSFVTETISLTDYVNNFRSKSGVWDRSNAFDSNNQLAGSYIKDLLDAWNDNINQTGGYVYAELGKGIMTYDKPIDENPTKVTQLIGGSLRIANSKLSNGDWDWRTVLTGDGIAGQEIIANSITVNKVSSDFGASLDLWSNEAITALVKDIGTLDNGQNLIVGANGELGYNGWEFSQPGLYPPFAPPHVPMSRITPTFIVEKVHSLSKSALKFFTEGKALSPVAYIVPNEIYSLRLKRQLGMQSFSVSIIEFNAGMLQLKKTSVVFDDANEYEDVSFKPTSETMYARFEIETHDNMSLVLTEIMFNRGTPSIWKESSEEVRVYAETIVQVLDNKLKIDIEEVERGVDGLSHDIHNAGVEINAKEGITTYGDMFRVMDSKRQRDVFKVVTVEGKEEVKMLGSIQSEGGEIAFDSENKEIKIGSAKFKGSIIEGTPSLHIDANRLNIGDPNSEVSFMMRIRDENFLVQFASTGTRSMGIDNINIRQSGYAIGSSDKRLGFIYLQNQPNVSSDKRYKYNVSQIDDLLLDEFENLQRKSFVTKHDDKYSFGYIAQDVERCLYKYILKVWGYSEANQWLSRFKLLARGESYLSLLYAEVDIIMAEVETRARKREIEELRKQLEEQKKEHQQLRNDFDALMPILKEKGVI